jgi:alpha-glucosidase
VPLPWQASAPGFGFGPPGGATPWLPQPEEWERLAADRQAAEPGSMLALYRAALRARAARRGLADDTLTWLDSADGVLAFRRAGGFTCVVNLAPEPVPLPGHDALVLASGPLDGPLLPSDTAAWLATAGA